MMHRAAAFGAVCYGVANAQPSCNQVDGDYPGCGISKSTYSATDPIAGKTWLSKYFPVQTPKDECTNDVCQCPASSNQAAWEIQQGRVYTTRGVSPWSSSDMGPGNGFGLHLVDVSAHLTTGGLSTADVEKQFTTKLGDMTVFDSFMDFNVAFATSDLQGYKDTFDGDGVKYFAATWGDSTGAKYTSLFVQVPGTQMVLELIGSGSLTYASGDTAPVQLEQRVPSSSLSSLAERAGDDDDDDDDSDDDDDAHASSLKGASSSASTGSYIVSLVVNRAVSASVMAQLEEFYVTGMGTTKSHDASSDDVTKKCFLWPGATVNICFTSRLDSATSGDWKVSDFEEMLNTVHSNIIDGYPMCPMDKWGDNHYAIDSHTADTDAIISYINSKNPHHICEVDNGSTALHYVFDPSGWGIQLDLGFSTAPTDCSSISTAQGQGRTLFSNPACTVDTSECPSSLFASSGRGLLSSTNDVLV